MIDEDCLNFLAQTSSLRFSPRWESVRAVLASRDVDASHVILFGCDHAGGDDMALWLALPDEKIINCILRKEAPSGRYASIVEWEAIPTDADEELLLASRVASEAGTAKAFKAAIESFRHFCEHVSN